MRDIQRSSSSSQRICNSGPSFSTPATKLPRASMTNSNRENDNHNNSTSHTKHNNGSPKNKRRTGGFNPVLFQREKYAAQSKRLLQQSQDLVVDSIELAPASPRRRAAKKRKVIQKSRPTNALQQALTRASTNLSDRAHKIMDELEENRRQQTSKERISECLIRLRAASERSRSLREYQHEHESNGRMDITSITTMTDHDRAEATKRTNSLRDVVGDMGLALFSPLDLGAFEPLDPPKTPEARDEVEEMDYPVELMPEAPSAVLSCPRLLTPSMFQQLVDNLPPTVKTMTWKRLFALGRDGDTFTTMLDRVHSFTNTIVVVETTWGHILGGYASAPWDRQGGLMRSFYGTGQSFLFANHPDDGAMNDDDDVLNVYKWTGNNNYCQVCDVDDGQLAMGGGGAFGLIVEENFSKGSTGRCGTFGNPALIPNRTNNNNGGTFEVLNFEVYGFSSMLEAFSPKPVLQAPSLPRQQSLLRQGSPALGHHKTAF